MSFFTWATAFSGVKLRPEGNFTGCLWPLGEHINAIPTDINYQHLHRIAGLHSMQQDAYAKRQDVEFGIQGEPPTEIPAQADVRVGERESDAVHKFIN